jgi:hypothetical protein
MANSVKYNPIESAIVDLTDYIDSIDLVPLINRNRDYTLTIPSVSLVVSVTIRDYLDDDSFVFDEGKYIYFYSGTTIVYSGIITSSFYNAASMTFKISTRSILSLLDTNAMLIEYSILHTLLSTGTNWWEWYVESVYSPSGPNDVGVLWLLKILFYLAGVTSSINALDVSGVEDVVLWHATDWDIDITYKDLMIDEGMLYCINQSVATKYTVIDDANNDYNTNKITFFELVSEIFSSLGLTICQTGNQTFELKTESANYTLVDDDVYEYESGNLLAEKDIADIGIHAKWLDTFNSILTRGHYYVETITDIPRDEDPTKLSWIDGVGWKVDKLRIPKGTEYLTPMFNLCIFYTDAKLGGGYGSPYNTRVCYATASQDKIITVGGNLCQNIVQKKVLEKTASFQQETVLTNKETTYSTISEHTIDFQWDNSNIKQETF